MRRKATILIWKDADGEKLVDNKGGKYKLSIWITNKEYTANEGCWGREFLFFAISGATNVGCKWQLQNSFSFIKIGLFLNVNFFHQSFKQIRYAWKRYKKLDENFVLNVNTSSFESTRLIFHVMEMTVVGLYNKHSWGSRCKWSLSTPYLKYWTSLHFES